MAWQDDFWGGGATDFGWVDEVFDTILEFFIKNLQKNAFFRPCPLVKLSYCFYNTTNLARPSIWGVWQVFVFRHLSSFFCGAVFFLFFIFEEFVYEQVRTR